MQKVAAYILQRSEGMGSPEVREAEGDRVRGVVEAWLKSKGASAIEDSGTYAALDGSDATYRILSAVDGRRSWKMYELSEVDRDAQKFVTSVSVTVGETAVVVFVTMEVGSVSSSITRVEVDPKCPRVIRELLRDSGGWHHGPSSLHTLSRVQGFEEGEALAHRISDAGRTVPIVVVSRVQGAPSLPKLDEKLAHDLAGIANVYTVDEEASWALTDILRKPFSTYSGAVRIYWPRLEPSDNPLWHQLWTATRLRAIHEDPSVGLERFRRTVRRVVMPASAASVVRPFEIDEIRGATARAEHEALHAKAEKLEQLQTEAKSVEDFEAIVRQYADDGKTLRRELESRDAEIEKLRRDVQRLESDKEALCLQLKAKRSSIAPEVQHDAPEADEADEAPRDGEVRFYKKTHSALLASIETRGNSVKENGRGFR